MGSLNSIERYNIYFSIERFLPLPLKNFQKRWSILELL